MPTWVQHPITGEFIPKHLYERPQSKTAFIKKNMEPFVSPIDQSIISDHGQLREHNKRHGVTDTRDYSQEHFDKAAKKRQQVLAGTGAQAKQERREALRETIERSTRR